MMLDACRICCAHCDAVFGPDMLDYGVMTTRFNGARNGILVEKFMGMTRDEETDEFLLRAKRRGKEENVRLAEACTALRKTMSLTEANAMLGRGAMHVFSRKQVEKVLEVAGVSGSSSSRGWYMDVGAGCGEVTETLARVFGGKTCATESSAGMAARLRERGFEVVLESDSIENVVERVRSSEGGDDLLPHGFDVVSALNLVDRIETPMTLMRQLRECLQPGRGILILAIVVPFRPFVERADGSRGKPLETVNAPSSGSWEAGVEALWENLIQPSGFELVALTRVPYISEGDHKFDAYVLDDAVFVLRAPAV